MDSIKEFERDLAYYFSDAFERPYAKPQWIYISLSHRCTYSCQMCGVVKILKGHELRKELIVRTFDEIAGWQSDSTVVLTGGEPFLRKDIFEIIAHAAQNFLKIEAVSNGSLIEQALADQIIASGLSNIAISLDGAREETHDNIRQKGAFKKALKALEYLVAAKKKNGGGPQISVWTTIMKENVRELSDIIPLARGLGVECLVYHPVIVAQDDMQNTSRHAPFWIRAETLGLLKQQLDKIVAYQNRNGLVAFLHDPYLWIKYFEGALTKKEWKCNPFVFLNIGPDAQVRSCGAAFGSLHTMGLGECLRTPEASEARRVMKACPKPCLQTCWARPESDSLQDIVERFIAGIHQSGLASDEKKNVLLEAHALVIGYQDAPEKLT